MSKFEEKLEQANAASEQSDNLNEEVVLELLTAAQSVIDMLRKVKEKMSPDVSFTARAAAVLQQIDVGLLQDPISVRVLTRIAEEKRAAEEAAAAKAAGTKTTSTKTTASSSSSATP